MSVRVGVVGLGVMGINHAERMEGAGADIVVGADVSADAREAFADRFDAVTYADHDDMYERDLDAVVITVPNALHEEVAVAALDRDVNTLVEKPLAHSVESAERIAAAERDSEAFCAVGFVMRYYDAVRELLARSEEFGDITHVEANYIRRNEVPEQGWFIDPDLAGGGALIDVGVHVLDLALAVLDFPEIDGVYGRTRAESADLDIEDSASALVRCGNGATVSLEVAWAANREPARELVVRGRDGGARLDIRNFTLTVYPGPNGDPVDVPTENSDWLAPEDEAFVHAVERGDAPSIGTVEQAYTVQRVLDAIYRSDESGVSVSPDTE